MLCHPCFGVQLEKLREEDKHEMSELRSQHQKAITALSGPGTGISDVMTDLYDASLQKYDILRKDYDDIRERYADLMAQHSSACCQLEAMVDLRKQVCVICLGVILTLSWCVCFCCSKRKNEDLSYAAIEELLKWVSFFVVVVSFLALFNIFHGQTFSCYLLLVDSLKQNCG